MPLGSLGQPRGPFGGPWGALGVPFGVPGRPLGDLWGHFGRPKGDHRTWAKNGTGTKTKTPPLKALWGQTVVLVRPKMGIQIQSLSGYVF